MKSVNHHATSSDVTDVRRHTRLDCPGNPLYLHSMTLTFNNVACLMRAHDVDIHLNSAASFANLGGGDRREHMPSMKDTTLSRGSARACLRRDYPSSGTSLARDPRL